MLFPSKNPYLTTLLSTLIATHCSLTLANPCSSQENSTKPPEIVEANKFSELESIDKLMTAGNYSESYKKLQLLAEKVKKAKPAQKKVLLEVYEKTAICLARLNRFNESERILKFAMGALKPGEDDTEGHSQRARVLFYLSDILDQVGQYKEASIITKQGINAVRHLAIGGQLPFLEAELSNIDARMMLVQGKLNKAGELINEASYMANSLEDENGEYRVAGSPTSGSKNFLKAKVLLTEAMLAETEGKIDKSKAKYREAAEIFEAYSEEALKDHRYAKLVFQYTKNADLSKKVVGKDNLIEAAYMEVEADKKIATGDGFKDAATLLEGCLAIREKNLEPTSAIIGNTKVKLAQVYLELGQTRKAAGHANKAYQILARTVAQSSPAIANATATLGKSYLASGVTSGVEPLLTHAWNIEAKRLGNNSPPVLSLMETLSRLYYTQRDYKKAIQVGMPVTAKLEKDFGTSNVRLVPTLFTTGSSFARLKKYAKARLLLARAKTILEKSGRSKSPEYGEVLSAIGVNEALNFNWKGAKPQLKKAIAVYQDIYGQNHQKTIAMIKLYNSMSKRRKRIPGLNKNVLLQGKFKPMAPASGDPNRFRSIE